MNKRTTSTLMTRLRWGAFFLVLLFLVIQVMPRALGQRGQQDISKRTSDIQAPSDPASGTWTATGSLNTGRFLHTATLLPNGMVLVAGGLDSNFHSSAIAELSSILSMVGNALVWRSRAIPCRQLMRKEMSCSRLTLIATGHQTALSWG